MHRLRGSQRPRRPVLAALWGSIFLLPCFASCGLNLPQGPELAELDAAYDAPRGLIDGETVEEVVAVVLRRLDTILGMGRLDFVTESLTEVAAVVQETVRDDGDTHFRIKALTSVEKECPGAGEDPGVGGMGGMGGQDSGRLTYTMRIERNGILDTVWGDFDACSFPDPGEVFPGLSEIPRVPGALLTYDGSMDIYLGGNLQLAELDLRRFLFQLQGTLDFGTRRVDVDLDFRVQADGRTEVRVPARSGNVILLVPARLGLRRTGGRQRLVLLRLQRARLCLLGRERLPESRARGSSAHVVKRAVAFASGSRVLLSLIALSWIGLTPRTALANHTEEDRQTEVSAFTLQGRQARLGLFKLEYGLFDRWMVGTYTLPWVLMPILGGPVLNLYTKVKLLEAGDFHLAGRLGFYYANVHGLETSSVDDGAFRGTIVPVTAQGSYLFGKRWTVSGELTWVQSIMHGDVESASESSVGGAVGQSIFQMAASSEYRFNKHVALNMLLRFAPYVQPLQLTTDAEVGGDTDVNVQAEFETDNQNAFLIQTGLTFSWGIWNLRAGVGVGNIFIPGPQLVTAVRTIVPDFDFYARF